LKILSAPLKRKAVLAHTQRPSVDASAAQRPLDPATRLRLAREQKGLSHRQLAEATKLSVRAIELLERDALAQLPSGIYRRSIVRAVAREVGLNPDQLLAEFAAVHPDDLPSPAAAVVVAPKPVSSFQRALAFVSAALPILASIVYFAMPGTPEPQPQQPPPTQPRKVESMRSEILPIGGFSEPPSDTPLSPVVITLTISSRCQLRVVSDANEIISRVMEPGETLPVDLGDEVWLLGDNAAAVQFSINGQAGRMLGEPGDLLSVRIGRDDYQDFLVKY
jgi:transcriptional regulator with XRE-family HTH domain